MQNEQVFSYIMVRFIFHDMIMMSALY